ncbi:MAG: ferrochelatase [Gemmatimonadales bacterium]
MAGDVAVLMMAYGGPAQLDDVEPYLLDVRGGRDTSRQLVDEVRARYARIGGRSPILELTRAQAAGVAQALGAGFRVHVGMRHWHPYIAETVEGMLGEGLRRVVGIVMAPHYSGMSVGAYEKQLLAAAHERLETTLVRSWWEHPRFLQAVAQRVTQGLQRFPAPGEVEVIFTAHSLPARILERGDPYPDELERSAADVAKRLDLRRWRIAYQSAGATAEAWLGPDAGDVIAELARERRQGVLLVPIGFVCDHVEILYDIDVAYQELARRLNIQLERIESLNDDPGLVAAVADVVRAAARAKGWL